VIIQSIRSASVVGAVFCLALALQASAQTVSLRGNTGIAEPNQAAAAARQDVGERFTLNYRQQPPLIPHKIDKVQINLKINQCLRCHDWPGNVEENAPKISETHYFDRNGAALDAVSRTRWFCTQCHVTQSDVRPLVENTFKPARINK
jgi:cytochrome c-type protein NapB